MQQLSGVLEAIDLDLNKKDMVVLGALLKAQNRHNTSVSFESLREQLARDEGGKKGKDSLIYRSLSWLEQVGLIEVDRSGHKHGYLSNIGLMHKVVKQAIQNKSSELAKEIKTLDTEIRVLSDIAFEPLAADMISLAVGARLAERPVFAQGWQNILNLLDSKIYRNIRKHDVIRYTLEWYDQPQDSEASRIYMIEEILKKGADVRAVEHKKLEKKRIQRFAEKLVDFRRKGYTVGYRMCLRDDSTYQFIGRNSEGILLIVSENPLSATWLPRGANPELIDNAIQSFDKDYNEGVDILSSGE